MKQGKIRSALRLLSNMKGLYWIQKESKQLMKSEEWIVLDELRSKHSLKGPILN